MIYLPNYAYLWLKAVAHSLHLTLPATVAHVHNSSLSSQVSVDLNDYKSQRTPSHRIQLHPTLEGILSDKDNLNNFLMCVTQYQVHMHLPNTTVIPYVGCATEAHTHRNNDHSMSPTSKITIANCDLQRLKAIQNRIMFTKYRDTIAYLAAHYYTHRMSPIEPPHDETYTSISITPYVRSLLYPDYTIHYVSLCRPSLLRAIINQYPLT